MSLKNLKKDWEELGEIDAFWAVSSLPGKKYNNWEMEAFFEQGREEIDRVLKIGEELGLLHSFATALDFGCGIGRGSRALSRRFGRVIGVDISDSMIRQAKLLNREYPNCEFQLSGESLTAFGDDAFDFVYSNIVLQHMPNVGVVRRYVAELLRVTKPTGLLYFQLPSTIPTYMGLRKWVRARLYRLMIGVGIDRMTAYKKLRLHPGMNMQAIPEEQVATFIARRGGRLVHTLRDVWPSGVCSSLYFVTKDPGYPGLGRVVNPEPR